MSAPHRGRRRHHEGVRAHARQPPRAARARPGHDRHDEGQAAGQGVRRLEPERPPQDDRVRVLVASPPAADGVDPGRVGRARRRGRRTTTSAPSSSRPPTSSPASTSSATSTPGTSTSSSSSPTPEGPHEPRRQGRARHRREQGCRRRDRRRARGGRVRRRVRGPGDRREPAAHARDPRRRPSAASSSPAGPRSRCRPTSPTTTRCAPWSTPPSNGSGPSTCS